MGVPADELTTTVAQWNECCENGKDIFFHRPADTLTPVCLLYTSRAHGHEEQRILGREHADDDGQNERDGAPCLLYTSRCV